MYREGADDLTFAKLTYVLAECTHSLARLADS
jgi:hypothetical protein